MISTAYKLNLHSSESSSSSVTLDLGSGRYLCIPFDEDKTDYQTYKAWVYAGNTPDPA